jgi:hypothetical protein
MILKTHPPHLSQSGNDRIIIAPNAKSRQEWAAAFSQTEKLNRDLAAWQSTPTNFDQEDWQW